MARRQFRSPKDVFPILPPPRLRRFLSRHQLLLLLFLSLVVLSGVIGGGSLLLLRSSAAGLGVLPSAASNLTYQQFLKQGQQDQAYHGPLVLPSTIPNGPKPKHSTDYANLPPTAEPPTMKPITRALSSSFLNGGAGASALDLVGSDGRLEIQVQPGSFDVTQATVAGGGPPSGTLTLQVSQLQGYAIGEMNALGSYQMQVVDSGGHVVNGIRLTQPVTILYHYQSTDMDALDLDPGKIVLTWPTLIASALQAKQPTASFQLAMQNDPKVQTLSTQSTVMGPGPFDITGEPQNQSPPALHLASVQGNSGQVTYSYPLQVPPGPGGFAPQLLLNYSSSAPNERHTATSPAGDEGDGWQLGLGSISEETYGPSKTMYYFINDVAGIGDRLVATGSNNLFDTEHISYLRIQQINPGTNSTCFHVWDKSGTYYELGCTADSLQYWTDSTGQHDYRWDVDKILAPNEGPNAGTYRLILLSYLQDKATTNTYISVRDAAIKQITYGTGTTSTISNLAGTVDFHYLAPKANGSWADAYGTNYNCTSTPPVNTTWRCDDPVKNGSILPPTVMSTLTLETVTSYVGSDTNYKDYGYSFSYTYQTSKDNPFSTCYDPYTLAQEYCAGEHLLMSVTPTVYQNNTGTPLKGVTFGYSSPLQDTYYDSTDTTQNGSQQYAGQTFWQYLNFYEDLNTGVGGGVTWARAYNNTHGTPTVKSGGVVTDDRYDALYCTKYPSDCSSSSYGGIYAHPDDHAWSEQVVTQLSALGTDSSSGTLQAAITTYGYYRLARTGNWDGHTTWCEPDQYNQEQDCVGDNWLPSGDTDWQDYFHAEYQGFAQVWSTSPSNDLTVQYYDSTEGWYTPMSDPINFEGGSMYQEEYYSGNSYTPGALLRTIATTYADNNNACRSITPTYPACEVVVLKVRTTDYPNNPTPAYVEHDYGYDDYSVEYGLAAGYHNLEEEDVWGSNTSLFSNKWSYTPNDQTVGQWTYYLVDQATHSEIDASGHTWQCQDTTYDEGSGNNTPTAGWPTTMKTYSNTACTSPRGSPLTTTYAGYDNVGNPLVSVDGVATANSALYASNGCTASPAIVSSSWGQSHYTSCTAYDSYQAQPQSVTNALGQSGSLTYDSTQGRLPTSAIDVNSQTTSTSYTYTGSSSTVQVSQPGETGSYTTQSSTSSSCTNTSTLPCFEIDTNLSLYSSVHSSTFYDSLGRAVETRTPGPGSGDDTIVITTYNDQLHTVWQSVPFEVAHGSGWLDPNGATDYQGVAPGGTVTVSDALGRPLAVQDPNIGQGQDGITCSATLTGTYTACTNYGLGTVSGDSNTYFTVTSVDPNQHVSVSYSDALGRTVYALADSGLYGGTLSANQKTAIQYNVLNEATQVLVTDLAPQSGQSITSVTTTAQYDDLGRLTQLVDPDRGTHAYTYDNDGRVISDVSGTRTIGDSYDLLGRLGCVQDTSPTQTVNGACTSGATQYIVNTYDTTQLGTQGSTDFPVGQLTRSVTTTHYPGTSTVKISQLSQHDKRGQLIDEQLSFLNLPNSWNVTTALPTYKAQYQYNDANQLTTTTTSTNPAGQGYTTTQTYDSTTGVLTGLSNGSATLATLIYNARAQLDTINDQTTGGTALMADQFGYDANLRPTTTTATWGSGSGNSGTAYSQSRSYDPASNLISLATSLPAVPGVSGSGGSETQNYCYDEQNRLVWAGNSGTQPGAGNGTCGSGTLSNTLSGANYHSSYVYTHLGQLWQGPLNGGSSQYQYLYCSSSTPHQLTGLYSTSATCSNKTGQGYASSYDAWGNVTSRTYSSTTATLSYDLLDHFTQWYVSSTNQEQYAYDADGNRVLRRSTTGSSTTITVYAFGLEEHLYSGSGTNQGNTYYYSLAGHLIGSLDGNGTTFYLTDALGSILTSFTNPSGSAAIKGEQTFAPYGSAQYHQQGSINTAKGFTGQYNDALTGLDYFNARYYDPVVGVFLSADKMQGNLQGMNPYGYVGGNPETRSDPTGHYMGTDVPLSQKGGAIGYAIPGTNLLTTVINTGESVGEVIAANGQVTTNQSGLIQNTFTRQQQDLYGHYNPLTDPNNTPWAKFKREIGLDQLQQVWGDPNATWQDKGLAILRFIGTNVNNAAQLVMILGAPEADEEGGLATGLGECGQLSFTPSTPVATSHGEQAIGTMKVGEQVWAYNSKTGKMELEPVQHVWINHDSDLVDLTLTSITPAGHGKPATKTSETIHTNKKHPFLTEEKGFLPVGQITLGMHILRADGTYGVVTGWKVVSGTKTMYNLEVAQDHTFTVGTGHWVVHNACFPTDDAQLGHIFRNARGHFPDDTPANRALISDTISSGVDLGVDANGNETYTQTLPDGRQVWVQVRGNAVQNAGINNPPWRWDPIRRRLVP